MRSCLTNESKATQTLYPIKFMVSFQIYFHCQILIDDFFLVSVFDDVTTVGQCMSHPGTRDEMCPADRFSMRNLSCSRWVSHAQADNKGRGFIWIV